MYNFYADPGHGWIKVSISELEKLKIADKISGCSYMRKGWAYLEEDCDLSIFFKAKNFSDFDKVCKTHTNAEKMSKIRNYESYDYTLYKSLLKVIIQYDTNEILNKWINITLDEKSKTSYFKNKKKYDDLSNNAKSWFIGIVKNFNEEIKKSINQRMEYLVAFNSDSLTPQIQQIIQDKQTLEKMEIIIN